MIEPANLMDPAVYGAGIPIETYAWLREHDPIHWNEPYARHYEDSAIQPPPQQGFWALTRFADVSHVSRHPELFSSEHGTALMGDVWPHDLWMWQQQLILMDPPRHTQFRRVLSQGFTPRRIRELHGFIQERCAAIVDMAASLNKLGSKNVGFNFGHGAQLCGLPSIVSCRAPRVHAPCD